MLIVSSNKMEQNQRNEESTFPNKSGNLANKSSLCYIENMCNCVLLDNWRIWYSRNL